MKRERSKPNPLMSILGILLLILVLPIILVSIIFWKIPHAIFWRIKGVVLKCKVKRFWHPKEKFILFVYSNSKNWKSYIEKKILPRISKYAIILNWSERSSWDWKHKSLELKVFLHWTRIHKIRSLESKRNKMGVVGKEYNPIAIIFKPKGRVKVLRLWQAFKDYKREKSDELESKVEELIDAVKEFESKLKR